VASYPEQPSNVYIMDARTNDPQRITDSFNTNLGSWSPDGSELVISKGISESRGELLIMDVRTGRSRTLTKFGGPPYDPVWSPDGKEVAFTTGWGDLYSIGTNGKGLRQVTTSAHCGDLRPAWSPDGSHLAFERDCGKRGPGIYLVNPDGTGLTKILPWRNGTAGWSWSPDGSKIAITVFNASDEKTGLYIVGIDGSGRTRLTIEPVGRPIWSRDGRQILFIRDGQIWTIPSNGGTATQVTHLQGLQMYYWDWFQGP
jgi:Tol biopolymer transport system component